MIPIEIEYLNIPCLPNKWKTFLTQNKRNQSMVFTSVNMEETTSQYESQSDIFSKNYDTKSEFSVIN